jgi:hypothetical protein
MRSRAFKWHVDAANMKVFGRINLEEALEAAQRCIKLHNEWISAAKTAIECWVAVAMKHGVVKDARRMIARMLWAERAAWSIARNEESSVD